LDLISLVKILLEAYVLAEKALRALERHRLEALDAAFREAIPALEAFDKVLSTGNSAEIVKQSERVAERLGSIIEQLEQDNIDTGFFPELAKQIRRANTWDYFPTIKSQYQQLSPAIIDKLRSLHKQVLDNLSKRP
jgi:hypothetical protein